MSGVVVVGGGLAGLRACEGLRSRGHDGEIVLVGEEDHDPYDRPPLSKQFLAGTWDESKVFLRKPGDIEALALSRRHGPSARAVALDVAAKRVTLASGEDLAYDECIVTTGARARVLPGFEPGGPVHMLRTLDDSRALREAIAGGGRLLVIGGGFVGMEVAATARGLGCEVTVVEPLPAPLARALGTELGTACARIHEAHGVTVRTATLVSGLDREAGRALTAHLDDGSALVADVVLVGVGAIPNVDWLEGSGLAVTAGGIACDDRLRAGPSVTVAGDVAVWPHVTSKRSVRLEHRTNAAEQGDHAALTALGGSEPFETVPYVWSDQYDVKIQVLGLPEGEDDWAVVAGDLADGRAVAVAGRDGRVTGAVGFGMPRALMGLRAAVADGAPFEEVRQAGA